MKIVILRFSAEIGISDQMYQDMNEHFNPENTLPAVALESKISSMLGVRVKVEQIYDSWEEAGH